MIIKDFPILYNQKANGGTQQWHIWVEVNDIDGVPVIVTEYGQHEGVMTKSEKPILKGKNIGKANETTPVEQAVSEAESTFLKKMDSKYVLDLASVGSNIGGDVATPDPMLAKSYDDHKDKVVFPAYVQPKLDGIRCIVRRTNDGFEFYSRKGKKFKFLDHLHERLEQVMEIGELLDGELYNHIVGFQELTSIVRQETEPHENVHLVQFHCYDLPVEGITFKERLLKLKEKFGELPDEGFIQLVETQEVQDEEDIIAFHMQMRSIDYEGTMVRNAHGLYKFKYRSPDLLKYKDFVDEEFVIIGGKAGTGSAQNQCIFECETADKKPFSVRCEGPNEDREEQLRNLQSYIGKLLTVRYQEKTDDGIPRFPVGVSVRNYE